MNKKQFVPNNIESISDEVKIEMFDSLYSYAFDIFSYMIKNYKRDFTIFDPDVNDTYILCFKKLMNILSLGDKTKEDMLWKTIKSISFNIF